jgi:2,3-dihydroxybenzoate-AMP ligase
MTRVLEGFTPYKKRDAEKYNQFRWWSGLTFGDLLDRAASIHPDKEAFVDRKTRLTYGEAREKTDRRHRHDEFGHPSPGSGACSTPQLE